MTRATLREFLEHRQVPIYFGSVLVAAVGATLFPSTAMLGRVLEPLLGLMLFVTFLQVPLTELGRALSQFRFLLALSIANFLMVPILVGLMTPWMPTDPLVRLGLILVLLAPCVDYVVTFAHMGQADSRSLLAATPVLLVVQMLLLPLFLGFFLGPEASALVKWGPFLSAFVSLIAFPLVVAAAFQFWGARSEAGERVLDRLGLFPVPVTAMVLFVVVAAVTPLLGLATDAVVSVVPIYGAFAVLAPALGLGVGRLCGLPKEQRRSVAFSSATRNSLVVLPLGLAVPGALPVLPAVIVAQTLVELLAELVYVKTLSRV